MAQTIDISEFRARFTTVVAARYDELLKIEPTKGLSNLFKDNLTKVKNPTYQVRRGSEKVAIDVVLGSQGTRIQITKSTQKALEPFYFKMFFDALDLDVFMNQFGSASVSENVATEIIDGVAVHYKAMTDMLDRAYELFCSQALEFGTLTSFSDGSVVNFNRKADSMVDLGAGNYWSTTGTNPYKDIENMCNFIRQKGKYMGGVLNMLCGDQALNDLTFNSTVLARADIRMYKLEEMNQPERKNDGTTYHGTISCGTYIVHIYSYPQFYDDPTTNVSTPYLNPKKVYIMPPNPDFENIFAAVPQILTKGAPTIELTSGKYIMSEIIDPFQEFWRYYVKSRGIPVLLAVDTIGTIQVSA